MRLIDADEIMNEYKKLMDGVPSDMDKLQALDVLAAVDGAETVDAVKVIRCKDCHYARKSHEGQNMIFCTMNYEDFHKDGFCSYAFRKRKEGENG